MDALALLCTLHADGPSSLKRLRAKGCSHLGALVDREASEVAGWLDVEPAFARRLLREAKLLRARVGAEPLDSEEAPPVRTTLTAPPSIGDARDVAGTASAAEVLPGDSLPPTLPREVLDRQSVLDDTDRRLVEKISAKPPVETEAPTAEARPIASDEVATPESVDEPLPVPGPDPAGEQGEACDWRPGRIAGLDADLIEDLAGLGISSMAQLAAADSLVLTRSLGVTFAQARRLRFLARREVESTPAPTPAATAAEEPRPAEPESAHSELPEPVSPALEQAAAEAPAEPAESARFWEPRPFLDAPIAPLEPLEPQGVRVDPRDIEARPRFGEQFARAAAERKQRPEGGATSSPGKTVLGWNFEIPRPDAEELPEMLATGTGVRPTREAPGGAPSGADGGGRGEADPAGPFA